MAEYYNYTSPHDPNAQTVANVTNIQMEPLTNIADPNSTPSQLLAKSLKTIDALTGTVHAFDVDNLLMKCMKDSPHYDPMIDLYEVSKELFKIGEKWLNRELLYNAMSMVGSIQGFKVIKSQMNIECSNRKSKKLGNRCTYYCKINCLHKTRIFLSPEHTKKSYYKPNVDKPIEITDVNLNHCGECRPVENTYRTHMLKHTMAQEMGVAGVGGVAGDDAGGDEEGVTNTDGGMQGQEQGFMDPNMFPEDPNDPSAPPPTYDGDSPSVLFARSLITVDPESGIVQAFDIDTLAAKCTRGTAEFDPSINIKELTAEVIRENDNWASRDLLFQVLSVIGSLDGWKPVVQRKSIVCSKAGPWSIRGNNQEHKCDFVIVIKGLHKERVASIDPNAQKPFRLKEIWSLPIQLTKVVLTHTGLCRHRTPGNQKPRLVRYSFPPPGQSDGESEESDEENEGEGNPTKKRKTSYSGKPNNKAFHCLSMLELKRLLHDRGIDYRDCLDKQEMVAKLLNSRANASMRPNAYKQNDIDGDPEVLLGTGEQRVVDVLARSATSVAFIQTENENSMEFDVNGFLKLTNAKVMGSGTGFLWDIQGHIVTNYHIIAEALTAAPEDPKITVKLPGILPQHATVVGYDKEKDLAVLHVPANKMPKRSHPIPIGYSNAIQIGQTAIAIGNPLGLDCTMATGTVTSMGREVWGCVNAKKLKGCIQTSMVIDANNTGGPMLDTRGRLIGMNVEIVRKPGEAEGGFAIPVDAIRKQVNLIIRHGKVPSKPILGVIPAEDSVVRSMEMQLGRELNGVLAIDVLKGSSAEMVGITPSFFHRDGTISLGDLIVEVNNEMVVCVEDLLSAIEVNGDKDVVNLKVWRKCDEYKAETVKVQLISRKQAKKARQSAEAERQAEVEQAEAQAEMEVVDAEL